MVSFAFIETQKTELLARVRSWPNDRLNFHPRADAWSAVGVFDHLVRTEVAILDAARSGLADPHRIGFSDRLRTGLLTALFRSRSRVKVPKNAKQIVPEQDLNFEEVCNRWNVARKDLASFLESAPTHQSIKGIFRHPVGGWMNTSGILTFFSIHMTHHGYQLDRLESASRAYHFQGSERDTIR